MPGRGTSCSAWRHSPDQAGSTALPARAASREQPRILGSPPRDTWLKLRRVDRAINGEGVDTCLPRPQRRCTRCSKLRSTPPTSTHSLEIYDDDATLIVPPDGQRVSGRDAIRAAVQPTLALRPSAQIEVVEKLQTDGLALTHARWSIVGTDGGERVEMSGRGTIVSRRLPDGSWRIVLDNPLSPE